MEAGSATRTIVSERHVDPFIGGQRGSGADLERVARPEVVKPHGDATVFQQQFVTATSRVHGRLAVVKHNLSGDVRRRSQPKRHRERIGPGEMTDARKGKSVFAIQLRRLSILPFDHSRPFVRETGFGRVHAIGHLVRLYLAE